MEIKIHNKTENEIEMEIRGETHTLLNALKAALLEDKHVETATYDIEFPGISEPVLYVKTKKGADPIHVVQAAAKKVAGECDDFLKAFSKKAKA